MNNRLDKLAPGVFAKLNLIADTAVLAMLVFLSARSPIAFDHDVGTLAVCAVWVWNVQAAVSRHYSPTSPRSWADTAALTLLGVVGVTVAVAVTLQALRFLGSQITFDSSYFAVAFFFIAMAGRILCRPLQRLAPIDREVLIVGTGPMAMAAQQILRDQDEPCRVVGFLRLPGEIPKEPAALRPVLGEIDRLYRVLCEHPVDEVYIAARVIDSGKHVQKVVGVCEQVGVPFALPIHSVRLERAQLLAENEEGDGFLHYLNTRPKPVQYAVKRLIDIASSITALAVLSPLLIGVAVIIKLTSRGPVLFRQVRVGLHGATFNLLKFRSMVDDAEALQAELLAKNEQSGPVFKMQHDPRVTRIGQFIRKFSIDELPQLVNILRGDMTIVGPRPALPKEVAQYKGWQRRRLSVRPGLTCYWQVGGRNAIGFDEWMRLDLRYVDNWQLSVDLRLILRTFPVVLAGRGAS